MKNIMEIENLKKYFKTNAGILHAVDDVSMVIKEGSTMGVVGESGCGKSTLGRTMIHLLESTDGRIIFNGIDVTHMNRRGLRRFRKEATIIFQDPYSSLDSRFTVERIIREPLQIEGEREKGEINDRVQELMEMVGMDFRFIQSYPHELDGGRRQRIGIARALALNPKFIVCDEPVSALDVSIQAQVLNLLQDLQEKKNLTYMFVTHNMSVVRHISDSISVMYLGQLVETAKTEEIFLRPLHPYTKALLSAIPSSDIYKPMERIPLKGEISSPIDPKPGCRFAARCIYASEECLQKQSLEEVESGHFVSCCKCKKINS